MLIHPGIFHILDKMFILDLFKAIHKLPLRESLGFAGYFCSDKRLHNSSLYRFFLLEKPIGIFFVIHNRFYNQLLHTP